MPYVGLGIKKAFSNKISVVILFRMNSEKNIEMFMLNYYKKYQNRRKKTFMIQKITQVKNNLRLILRNKK
jgi:hypothetical protein